MGGTDRPVRTAPGAHHDGNAYQDLRPGEPSRRPAQRQDDHTVRHRTGTVAPTTRRRVGCSARNRTPSKRRLSSRPSSASLLGTHCDPSPATLPDRGVVGRRGRPTSAATLRPMLLSPTLPGSPPARAWVCVAVRTESGRVVVDRPCHLARPRLRRHVPSGTTPTHRPITPHVTTRPRRPPAVDDRTVRRVRLAAGGDVPPRRSPPVRVPRQRPRRIDADPLDAWVEHEVFGVISSPQIAYRLLTKSGSDRELALAREAVARIQAELDDLGDMIARGEMLASVAARGQAGIVSRLREAETRLHDLTQQRGLGGLVEPGPAAVGRWKNDELTPTSAKREVIKVLFAPGILGTLSIARVDGDSSLRARIRLDSHKLPPATV